MKTMTWALNYALTILTLYEMGYGVSRPELAKMVLEGRIRTPRPSQFRALRQSAYQISKKYKDSPEAPELEKKFEELRNKYGIENHGKALGHAGQRFVHDTVDCFYSRFADQDYMFINIESDNGKDSILLTKQQAILLKDILNEMEITE